MATSKLKPVIGATVRLNHDFHTRGGRIYRAGVCMRISHTGGEYGLVVHVRGRCHSIRVRKKDAAHTFTVISVPKSEMKE